MQNELTEDRVKSVCYDIARKICNESQQGIEQSCQYKRDNINSKADVKLGEIVSSINTLGERFDTHLRLHEKSEAFWKWFAFFIVVAMGAGNIVSKLLFG